MNNQNKTKQPNTVPSPMSPIEPQQSSSQKWLPLVLVISFAVLVGGGILGYQYWWVQPTTIPEPIPATQDIQKAKSELTLEAVRNAEYSFDIGVKQQRVVTFTLAENNEYIFPSGQGDGINHSFRLDENNVVFGDLNGDINKDAAAILKSWRGGTGVFYYLAILVNENGTARHITSEYLGDRIAIDAINIQSGEIVVNMRTHDPNLGGTAADPDQREVLTYKLVGDTLEKITGDETADESSITVLSPREGDVWVIGKTYQIQWDRASLPGETVGIVLVNTSIPTASLSKVWQKGQIPNTGIYDFIVLDFVPGNQYQIYISNRDGQKYSELFSIISP